MNGEKKERNERERKREREKERGREREPKEERKRRIQFLELFCLPHITTGLAPVRTRLVLI